MDIGREESDEQGSSHNADEPIFSALCSIDQEAQDSSDGSSTILNYHESGPIPDDCSSSLSSEFSQLSNSCLQQEEFIIATEVGESSMQSVPIHFKQSAPMSGTARRNSPTLWRGVGCSCSGRPVTNLHGRSLSENALHTHCMPCRDNSSMTNCNLQCDYQQGDRHSPNGRVQRRVNDVLVNIIPPLDMPPSYDFVCKTMKQTSENAAVITVGSFSSTPTTSTTISSNLPPTYREATADGRYLEDAPPTYHSLFTESMLRAMQPFTNNDMSMTEASNRPTWSKAKKVLAAMISFFLVAVIVGFILVMPLCMITVGVANIHNCPAQPRIPIYLIVLGIFQMLECCGRLGYYLCRASVSMDSRRERYKNKDPLVYFMVVWFVVGSMWVYQTSRPCFDCIPTTPALGVNVSMSTASPLNISTTPTTVHTGAGAWTLVPWRSSTPAPPTKKPAAVASENYCDATVYLLAFWLVTVYYSVVGFLCVYVILDPLVRIIANCCQRCQQAQSV